MTQTVAGLGEFALVEAITSRLPQGRGVLLGPGDDAAVIAAADGRVVTTTDLLVEGSHFRRDWSAAYDIGRKSAAASLADVVAMGARPTALVVGLAMPPDLPAQWALELADGLREECELVEASVVGGDVVRAPAVVVAVTALGTLEGREPVTRAGARPGHTVAIHGRLGWSAAGQAILSRGFRTPRVLVDAHRRPEPPYAAGIAAAVAGASAMCDVSDGLVQDLGHIARASGVLIRLDPTAVPVDQRLREMAGALGVDPLAWALTGGEDHALAACFPEGTAIPSGWLVVGAVHDGQAGPGVEVPGVELETGGYDHFANRGSSW